MKTALASLILFSIFSVNTIAQDTSQLGLPEGAKARLDIGGGRIFDVKYSPDGTRLAAASSSGVWLFDLETDDAVPLMRNGNSSSAFRVAFSPDGRTIAAAVDDSICLWDAATRANKHSLSPNFRWAGHVAFSPDGRMIAGGGGEIVHLWDVETGKRKYTVGGVPLAYVTSIAFSPDGRTLASGHTSPLATHSIPDGKIHFWDSETGRLKDSISDPIRKPSSLAYSPDGRTLASGHLDSSFGSGAQGWVSLWDAETLEFKRDLGIHPRGAGLDYGVECVAFSPDGSTLAIGRAIDEWYGFVRDTLRLWDVNTGENIRALEGHTDDVTSVAFSGDGSTLASASRDGTLLLWDISFDTDVALLKGDVNQDGVVNIQDLVLVATRLGQTGPNIADANGDGIVHILDLILVAGELGNEAGAPSIYSDGVELFSPSEVKQWLEEARGLGLEDVTSQKGIRFLERLLAAFTPRETALLPNYPNPFNPETWIPYQLATDSEVHISIYDSRGVLVRELDLGRQPGGYYTDRGRAAYWDGRNEHAETVASGVYFYQFRAADYSHMRRMVVVK